MAVAGGVTTISFIPGSGTNMGGWGALMKTGPGTVDEVVLRSPGVLKIAQAGNPERQAGEVPQSRPDHRQANFVEFGIMNVEFGMRVSLIANSKFQIPNS